MLVNFHQQKRDKKMAKLQAKRTLKTNPAVRSARFFWASPASRVNLLANQLGIALNAVETKSFYPAASRLLTNWGTCMIFGANSQFYMRAVFEDRPTGIFSPATVAHFIGSEGGPH